MASKTSQITDPSDVKVNKEKSKKQSTIVCVVTDHSASMRGLAQKALWDYRNMLEALKESASLNKEDVYYIHGQFPFSSDKVIRFSQVASIEDVTSIGSYEAAGANTPLWDATFNAISRMKEEALKRKDEDISFLLIVITDGANNATHDCDAKTLKKEIDSVISTDKWTVVFRVPPGYGAMIYDIGVPTGNILEWEKSEKGIEVASIQTSAAINTYMATRSSGGTSTKTFYVNTENVKAKELEKSLGKTITSEAQVFFVQKNSKISDFWLENISGEFQKGQLFYELTKTEKAVQDYKLVCLRNRETGSIYGGDGARDLMGLPITGTHPVAPGNTGKYDIFIQSTSLNRKLLAGTKVIYWPKARK